MEEDGIDIVNSLVIILLFLTIEHHLYSEAMSVLFLDPQIFRGASLSTGASDKYECSELSIPDAVDSPSSHSEVPRIGNETSDHAIREHNTLKHVPPETIRILALQGVSFRYAFQAGLHGSFTRFLHSAYIPVPHLGIHAGAHPSTSHPSASACTSAGPCWPRPASALPLPASWSRRCCLPALRPEQETLPQHEQLHMSMWVSL